jgi:hypothetical protein
VADSSANVVIQATGEIYAMPTGTSGPTSAISSLSAWNSGMVGYIGEDGVTQTIATESTEIKAWQNADVVATVSTSHKLTYQFPFLEMNDVTLPLYYGSADQSAETSAVQINITGVALPHKSWVIDVINDTAKVRIYIPDGQITERGDTVYANSAATVMPVTITCYPVLGIKAYKWVDHDTTVSS